MSVKKVSFTQKTLGLSPSGTTTSKKEERIPLFYVKIKKGYF